MHKLQVVVPRQAIINASRNVSNFDCVYRDAVFIKTEDNRWIHQLTCGAGNRQCECSCECKQRKRSGDKDKWEAKL